MNTAHEMEIRETAAAQGITSETVVQLAGELIQIADSLEEAGRKMAARGAAAPEKSFFTGIAARIFPTRPEQAAQIADILDTAYTAGYQGASRN